jgi:hypothetical protein
MTVMDVTSGAVHELPAPTGFTDKEFIYTTRVNWVKSVP